MQSYHIDHFGDIDGLVIREHALREPQPHEVSIRLRATSLNRRDLYILHQTYPLPPRPGVVPISDGVGEVVAIGEQVTRFQVGDRVAGTYFARWRDGRVGWDIADQLGCTLDGMPADVDLNAILTPLFVGLITVRPILWVVGYRLRP